MTQGQARWVFHTKAITKLESDFIVQAQDLEEVFIINQAEEFATELYKLALKYENLKLKKYAKELQQDLDVFNVEGAKSKVSQFEEIINGLKEK
ncbi:hypothetical protein [Halanaerobacter jeridensis]|uniref:hypothetical protein n=1 Tax=Halanaerobacter jeridensis TaxID=706427 RepID=UPI00195D0D3A|nr:hypothetical protein [Halanaerobacter jeridensis]